MRMRHIGICGLSGSTVFFPHYLIYGMIFEKLWNVKCVFWFSLPLLSETFFILRRTERDITTSPYRSLCKIRVILVSFQWNLSFSRQIFEKSSDIKFHENPSSGSRVVPCGRTDGYDEGNSRFSQFCPKNGRMMKRKMNEMKKSVVYVKRMKENKFVLLLY